LLSGVLFPRHICLEVLPIRSGLSVTHALSTCRPGCSFRRPAAKLFEEAGISGTRTSSERDARNCDRDGRVPHS
jgi:hypothetical protein